VASHTISHQGQLARNGGSELARHLLVCEAWWRVGLIEACTAAAAAATVGVLSLAAIAVGAGWVSGGQLALLEAWMSVPFVALLVSLVVFFIPWRKAPVAEVLQQLLGRHDDQLLTAAEALDGRAYVSEPFASLLQERALTIAQQVPPRVLVWHGCGRAPVLAVLAASVLFASSLFFPHGWTRLAAAQTVPMTERTSPPVAPGTLAVSNTPCLMNFSLATDPPVYTLKASESFEQPGHIRVPLGSRIKLQARFADCDKVELRWGNTVRRFGAQVVFEAIASTPVQWSLLAVSPSGQTVTGPFTVSVVPDHMPKVQIVRPSADLTLDEPGSVGLEIGAEDDYGLRRVGLQWRTGMQKQWQYIPLATGCGRRYVVNMNIDLQPMHLLPGDELVLRAVAEDNNEVTGSQVSYSPLRRVRIAAGSRGAQERPAREIDQATAQEEDSWQRLKEAMEQLGEEIGRMEQQLGRDEGADASQRHAQIADLAQSLQKAASDVKQAMGELERKMTLEGLVDEELLDKVAELHKLSHEILDEHMKQVLERLWQMTKGADLDKLRADARKLREMHDRFVRQIERTLDLLRQARMEMLLGALQKKISDLASRQENMVERTEKMQEKDEAARQEAAQQADLARQTQPLPEEMRLAAESIAAQDQKTSRQLENLAERIQREDPAGNMRQAVSALQRMSPSDARPAQQRALHSLRQAAADLAAIQADVMGQQRRELQAAAARAVAESLGLAQAQQQLAHQTESVAREMLPQAVQQKDVLERLSGQQTAVAAGARRLSEQLRKLAGKTPVVEPGLSARTEAVEERMAQAARFLQGGEGAPARTCQEQALAELNRLAADLTVLAQALGQRSAQAALSEYLKRLEQLADQQQALNQQSQDLGEGNPMLSELGLQQAMLKAALEKLMRGAGRQLSDKLGGVAEDMEEVANDLRARRLTEKTKAQQREILHKMLEAQRSLYTREQESRQRVAERPRPYQPPTSPPIISSQRPPSVKLPTLEEPTMGRLPQDYQDLAEAYLRRVRAGRHQHAPRVH
jgi:hypothetical protein